MSVETKKKIRLPILTGLSSIFRRSSKASQSSLSEPVDSVRTPSTRTSIKPEGQNEHLKTQSPSQSHSPTLPNQKKKIVMFSDDVVYSDESPYLPAPLQQTKSNEYPKTRVVSQTKGILVRKRHYSQQVGFSNQDPNSENRQNWVGLLMPEDIVEEVSKETGDEDSMTLYPIPSSPQPQGGLKKTFKQLYIRPRSDSAETVKAEGLATPDILDEVTSPNKTPKKHVPSIFKPVVSKEGDSYKISPKKEELSYHLKVNSESKPQFLSKLPNPSTNDNKLPSFNVSTHRVEDQNMQKVFSLGYMSERKPAIESTGQIKTDRVEYEKGSFIDSPFPSAKIQSKQNSGFESNRSNFALAASSILKPETYSGNYQAPSGHRLNIVTNYQASLPNGYASTPRKF